MENYVGSSDYRSMIKTAAGIGGCVYVFETQSGKFITKEEIFEGRRVHNIFVDKKQNIAIIGGKMVQTFKLETEDNFKLSSFAAWAIDDWIQYLHWLDCDNIAIVTAHNVVSLWNSRTGEKVKEIFCEVKSILYCALLNGSSWNELLVFAGTVFQQILVWAPTSLETETVASPVLHTLKGHDGVIFSVSYDAASQYICSTSDDRSVRLWSVDLQLSDGSNRVTQWKEAKITLLRSMYGHTARVWRNIMVDDVIISVGEDSCLCVWSVDGSLQKYWKTHQGASVWSVDCSKEKNLIVTGGADGGISLWPLHTDRAVPNLLAFHEHLYGQEFTSVKGHNQNFPRRIGLTSKNNIVAITGNGCLLYCTLLDSGQGNWKVIHQDEKLASYCLLEMSPCRQYVALGSMDGYILVFKEDCSSVQGKYLILSDEEKAVTGRIFSLRWLSSDNLLSCGPHGLLEMWKLGFSHQMKKVAEFELPRSKEQWISAAALREKFLVCGDRNGSIHLFEVSDDQSCSVQFPSQSFYKIHGHLGVSSLTWYGNYLYSTGRDGALRCYMMLENESRLECLNADKLQIDWPAATSLSAFGLLVLGFRAVNFVVWSHTERRTLLTVPCGGGHRSWDWIFEGHTFRLIYLKDKMVHMYTCMMDEFVKPVIQNGFHSKHITCVRQVLLKDKANINHSLLLSASEDTTIRLAVISHSNVPQTLTVLQSHISSVRTLAVCQLHDSVLVFSGGGRAQLKVWKLVIHATQEFIPIVKCQELTSHMLRDPSKRNKKPWLSVERTVDPETRYMDLCAVALQLRDTDQRGTAVLLAAGCSDGFLRIFGFYTLCSELRLLGKYSFHDRCILKVSLIQTENFRHIALTMATDGKVALWDLTTCVEELVGSEHSNSSSAVSADNGNNGQVVADSHRPFSFVKIHQSGINSFDWLQLQGDKYLLATGGDDRALVLSLIQIISPTLQENMQAEVVLQWRDNCAHASQITGLKLGNNVLISVAIDQRITVWNWNCNLDGHTLSASVKTRYCSAVADIQGLLTWNSSSCITACVHGKGMEIVTIQFSEGS
ncbi:WD repeat-containing protein 6 isoform X2 [Zootermopsis nevadensis]|uniref:WD repeat-containing protein 6 isoform X2 n=1 Tax=Zootermopsis nevadensis TaxID=136037 RepID=UPI000B8E2E44|nr:WD repeat-containing protein 6 isoform X2 [Zootermopsis nevadensis]